MFRVFRVLRVVGVLGFWGFGVLGFWGFGVLGFWGFGVLGFWGFGVLVGFWGFGVLGFWGLGLGRQWQLTEKTQQDTWWWDPTPQHARFGGLARWRLMCSKNFLGWPRKSPLKKNNPKP